MRIEHLALWTTNLNVLKKFYCKYFEAKANHKYINEKTGFESYFLSFGEECRLEIMYKKTLEKSKKNNIIGLEHFAISVGSKEKVILLTEKLRNDGIKILSEPRTTGDGYFESVISDPDGNRIEITV